MLQSQQVEELIGLVFAMDRAALIHQFRNYPARFPLDFSDEFLRTTSLERLKHIFVAICLQSGQLPQKKSAIVPAA